MLKWAARENHHSLVFWLINQGADPTINYCDSLAAAMYNGHTRLAIALAVYIDTNNLLEDEQQSQENR